MIDRKGEKTKLQTRVFPWLYAPFIWLNIVLSIRPYRQGPDAELTGIAFDTHISNASRWSLELQTTGSKSQVHITALSATYMKL